MTRKNKSSTFLRSIQLRRKTLLNHSSPQQSRGVFWKVLDKNKPSPASINEDFFADFCHDLRNSLTVVRGNLDLIFLERNQPGFNPSTLRLLKNIRSELDIMSDFLADAANSKNSNLKAAKN